jgi:RNase P/RNase MRP subunit POP5
MQRKKEKNIRPSMRENRRYLYIEGNREEIEKAILDYIGILGFSKASPVFISKDVFAVNREMINEIRAALALAEIKIKRVSGTIKGLSLS